MSKRSRGFTITLNNYNDSEYNKLLEVAQLHSKKWIFGKEVGKEGTSHIQGYIYFENGKTFNAVKELLDNARIHLENAKGSPAQNYTYCSKEGCFTSEGFINKEKEEDEHAKLIKRITRFFNEADSSVIPKFTKMVYDDIDEIEDENGNLINQ